MAYTRRSFAGGAAATTITGALASNGTSITIAAYTGWTYHATNPFYVVVSPGTSSEEKILVTRTTSTSTTLNVVTRGVDGTTAASHSSGATIFPVFTAVDADEANAVASTLTTKGDLLTYTGSAYARLAVGTNNYALIADSAQTNGIKWAAVGDVTLTGTQTLTNKTIAFGSNTVSGTLAQFNTAVTDADLVSLAGTETLTNKTLTSPVINASINTQTGTTYTLVVGDSSKVVEMNNASANTLTVPSGVFSVGAQILISQKGAGQTSISPGASVTLNSADTSRKLRVRYSSALLVCTASNEFLLIGDLTA